MDIESKKDERRHCHNRCNIAYERYVEAKNTMLAARKNWELWRDSFEGVDRELAEVDGRLTKFPLSHKKPSKTKAKPEALTLDQIKALAEKFGVALDLNWSKKECDFDE